MSEDRCLCSHCVFWRRRPGVDKEGFCCKNAPEPITQTPRKTLFVTWPITMADDWCGECRTSGRKEG